MENHSVIKRNKLVIHSMGINLINTVLSFKSQVKNNAYFVISFI